MAHVVTSLIGLLLVSGTPALVLGTVDCDFNDGVLCNGWDQGINHIIDEFDWSVGFSKGHLDESNSNTTNITQVEDFFLYMTATNHSVNHRAVFASPVMTSPSGRVNITFLYCMFGDQSQSLSVFIKDMSLVSYESEIWSRDGKDADSWTSVYEHANVTGPFRLILQGKVGKGSAAIAVDDIVIENAEILSEHSPDMTTQGVSLHGTGSNQEEMTPTVHHQPTTTTNPFELTTTAFFDMETVPLVLAAAGGVIFWLGVLTLITYFTCRRTKKINAKRHAARVTQTINRKLQMAAASKNDIEVSYAPRRPHEIKIYHVPTSHQEEDPVYSNHIPCVYNYDPLSLDEDLQARYEQCSPAHDYATIP